MPRRVVSPIRTEPEASIRAPSGNGHAPASGLEAAGSEPRKRGRFEDAIAWVMDAGERASPLQRYAGAAGFGVVATLIAFVIDAADAGLGLLSLPVLLIVLATFVLGFRAGLVTIATTVVLLEVFLLGDAFRIDFTWSETITVMSFIAAALLGGAVSEAVRESRHNALQLAEQRQQLLRAVLDSESHMRDLADALPVLISRASATGELDYFNEPLLQYTGMRTRTLIGQGWLTVVHPDDRDGSLARWQECVATGRAAVFEQRLRRHDGAYRWHLAFAEPVRDASGAISEWLGANVDIHDRKRAEQALQLSEARYRTLANTVEAIVCTTSTPGGPLAFFNQRFFDYTGLDPNALPEPPMRAVLHPEDYEGAYARWMAARESGDGYVSEGRLRRADGEYRWHMTRVTPFAAASGEGLLWMLTMVDIHDRKITEERLAASEERYRTLADSMDAMICMSSSPDGRLDFFNRQFFAYTGISPEAMPEVPMQAAIHPDDFEEGVRLWYRGRDTNEPWEGEFRFRRSDGSYRWHLARATLVQARTRGWRAPRGGPPMWLLTIVDIDDHKRVEEALRESEARYRTLIDAAPVFVYHADANGEVTFASESFYAYTGTRPDEVKDALTEIRRSLHPDDLPTVMAAWSGAQATGENFEMEARVRGADGTYRWFLSRLVATRDATGSVASWMGTSTNIDDLKRFEAALQESREEYRILSETIPALVTTNSADGLEVLFANDNFYEYTGLSPDDARRWDDYAIVFPEDREGLREQALMSLAKGAPMQVDVRLRRRDGQYRWHLMSVRALRGAAGELEGWISVSVDVHEQRIAEGRERLMAGARSLLATSLDYDDALDNLVRLLVPEMGEWAAIHVREHGAIRRVAFAYDDPAIAAWANAGDVLDASGELGPVRVLETGEPRLVNDLQDAHYAVVREDVRELFRTTGVQSSMLLPLQYAGETIGVLTVNSRTRHRFTADDLHFAEEFARKAAVALEHARLYSTLRAANAAKDEFLGLVSHELKTPITTILGNAEVLQRRAKQLDEETRAGALSDIQHDAQRLHLIIENLLILARLDRGQDIEMEPLLLHRLVGQVVEDHRRHFPGREVRLEVAPDAAPVFASEVYMEQVLRNLLSNAEKYSPSRTATDVRVRCDDARCAVEVMDRGPGVPPEERPLVFDAFWRSQGAGHVAGVGIGLAVCKRLVEAQGGEISYEPREGGGSVFRVALPVYGEEG